MKLFPAQQSRQEYLETQVRRSESKFQDCKVSVRDVRRYRAVLELDALRTKRPFVGPTVCLGTRNGREIDLFRTQWYGRRSLAAASFILEQNRRSFTSRLPFLDAVGRSDVSALGPRSVIGVEVNPRAARRDVWIGSFDEMPADWGGRFGVAFSNAFDQSEDPHRTAREWRRIVCPGGFLIICFTNDAEPSLSDRVGGLSLEDVRALFEGRLVYFHDRGSRNGYSEVILQL